MKIPINLVVFDTSRGHWGRTDIYKTCISNLDSKIPLNNFASLTVHIKEGSGEERISAEMETWYAARGFTILKSLGNFSHQKQSHQIEYCKDMITLFQRDYPAEYTLWLESDWCWDDKGELLEERFAEAILLLQSNKDILSVRFPRHLNEVDRLNKLQQKHGVDVQCVPYVKNNKFWIHNDNFSCNPNICRTRDLYIASIILQRNFEQFSIHSEMGWTKCLSWMSKNKYHYAIFDPKVVSVLHYGTKLGEHDVIGQVFEQL